MSWLVLVLAMAGQPADPGTGPLVLRIGGGDDNRYEALYGRCGEDDAPGLARGCVRRSGQLTKALDPAGTDYAGDGYAFVDYALDDGMHLKPVEELLDVFSVHVPSWVGRQVEVVGIVLSRATGERRREENVPPPDSGGFVYILVWEIVLLAEEDDAEPVRQATLEELVLNPLAFEGQPVAVQGAFRGANLFGDMPPESRRGASDWVLRDGPFFIWVTGREPSGLGFALDSGSKADCRWWLRVIGTVTVANGYVYLDAHHVHLVGPAHRVEFPGGDQLQPATSGKEGSSHSLEPLEVRRRSPALESGGCRSETGRVSDGQQRGGPRLAYVNHDVEGGG